MASIFIVILRSDMLSLLVRVVLDSGDYITAKRYVYGAFLVRLHQAATEER